MQTVWLHHLDQVGMGDPDNNEGQPEDVCSVCDRRIIDHPGHELFGLGDQSARWPHRLAVITGMILGRID